jgi:hypothetical protein
LGGDLLKEHNLLDIIEQIKVFIYDNYNDPFFTHSNMPSEFHNIPNTPYTPYRNSIADFINKHIEKKSLKYFLLDLIHMYESTQQEICNITLIDKGNFSKIINGKLKMSKDNCIKIALALKLSEDDYKRLFKLSNIFLSNTIKRDLILRYILENQAKFRNNYNKPDTVVINNVMEEFEQIPLF